jgi:perosamine synthetase
LNESALPYSRQVVDDDDVAAVLQVLKSDFLTQGSMVPAFEEALAERVGARHAVVVSSGTAALHLACLAAGVGPGAIGITSALTFVASANAVAYCGGRPFVADVDADSLSLSPATLRPIVSQLGEPAVVLPVHFAGLAGDSADLRAMTKAIIIEDAAHALGGAHADGSLVGSCAHADMCVLSFHPVKTITTGEGGAVTTNDDELARVLRLLRNHGIERDVDRFVSAPSGPWHYEQQALGFNYRMSDLQAALGLSQLGKLERFVARRRAIALRYDEAFVEVPSLTLFQADAGSRARSSIHLYVVGIDFTQLRTTRERFMADLRSGGVGSQVHYIPVHHHPVHADQGGRSRADFPVTERFYERCLSLPVHPGMSDSEVERVIEVVATAAGQ